MTNTLLFHLVNYSSIPLEILILKLTHIFVIYVSVVIMGIGHKYRLELSMIIQFANEKSLEVLQSDQRMKYRQERNRVYLYVLMLRYSLIVGSVFGVLQYTMESVMTGELFFRMFLPPGVPLFVQNVIVVVILIGNYAYAVNLFVIVCETFLVLATPLRMVADEVRKLRSSGTEFNEEAEEEKLKSYMREVQEIRRMILLSNRVFRPLFMLLMFETSFFSGLLIGVSFTMDSVLEKTIYLAYPFNLLAIVTLLCNLGQAMLDASQGLEAAVYECDWYSAPRPFKKLVLMFLIQCQQPIGIDAKPFYKFDLMLLARVRRIVGDDKALTRNSFQVVNKIYQILTLVRQFI